MNSRFFKPLLTLRRLLLLPLAAIAGAQTPALPGAFLPLPPAELVKLLPQTPKGWELKESRAKSFYNEALASQANRKLIQLPQQASTGITNTSPATPAITFLRITDTAGNSAMFADFEEFKPGRYGNTESLYFDSLPARQINLPHGERLRVLVRRRFVVEVETHDQPPGAASGWARQFDFARLGSIPDPPPTRLPNPVTVVSIDELNPSANSTYQLSWSTQEDLDAARNRKR